MHNWLSSQRASAKCDGKANLQIIFSPAATCRNLGAVEWCTQFIWLWKILCLCSKHEHSSFLQKNQNQRCTQVCRSENAWRGRGFNSFVEHAGVECMPKHLPTQSFCSTSTCQWGKTVYSFSKKQNLPIDSVLEKKAFIQGCGAINAGEKKGFVDGLTALTGLKLQVFKSSSAEAKGCFYCTLFLLLIF